MEAGARPFRATEELAAGRLTLRELRRFHQAVYPGVWAPRGAELSARERARAAWLWSNRTGVIAGLSAAALLGAKWIEPGLAADLVHTNRRPPRLIEVHTDNLASGETQLIEGMAVTTAARTAFDIGRRLDLEDGVKRMDALLNATRIGDGDIEAVIQSHPGVRGLNQLRRTLALVDGGAESPQESLTRLLLVQAGFPKPETQIELRDLRVRIDMGWRRWKVAVEYDGVQHWTDRRQRSWDIERIAELEGAGWIVIRVSAEMLSRRHVVLDRVSAALQSPPLPEDVVSVRNHPPNRSVANEIAHSGRTRPHTGHQEPDGRFTACRYRHRHPSPRPS